MIPFYRPYLNQDELLAALRAKNGREEFERAVANQMGAKFGIAFAYGRVGLFATLKALNIQESEIILTAYTCVVMAQSIVISGNQPVFVDINLTDYNMDLDLLPRALTSKTKMIIATHMYGYQSDVNAIRTMVNDESILIVEDCAQKVFSPWQTNSQLQGDIGLCSFGLNKELSTVQGGIILTNSADLYQKIKSYRDQTLNEQIFRVWIKRWLRFFANYLVYQKMVYGVLHKINVVGLKNRLDETSDFNPAKLPSDFNTAFFGFQGRIGLAQLKKFRRILDKRHAIAQFYNQKLEQEPGIICPPLTSDANLSYYTLRIPKRDEIKFRHQLLVKGVAVDETYEYSLPYLKPYRIYARTNYPNSLEAAHQVVNLPIYPDLSITQIKYIVASIRSILQSTR